MRWAVYISSNRAFSHAESRSAAAQEISAAGEGHENNRRFDPAVLRVKTFAYFLGGESGVPGTVIDPRTCINYPTPRHVSKR